MREISLHDEANLDKFPLDTFLLYGDTGTGKTTCSASWPRPLFLADATEGGWKSLRGLADDQLFESNVDPMVWGIAEMNDMATALQKLPPYIASGRVRTVVISSITFYAATYLAHLNRVHAGDNRRIYGDLGVHLRELRTQIHNLGINVIWEALADHPEAATEKQAARPGRPQIAGKAADAFAAGVTYLWRMQLDEVRKDGKVVDYIPKIITQNTGGYIARRRDGKLTKPLPSPLLGGYGGFLEAQGYDIDRLRRTLPPIKASASAPKPTTAPKVASPPSGAKAAATTNK